MQATAADDCESERGRGKNLKMASRFSRETAHMSVTIISERPRVHLPLRMIQWKCNRVAEGLIEIDGGCIRTCGLHHLLLRLPLDGPVRRLEPNSDFDSETSPLQRILFSPPSLTLLWQVRRAAMSSRTNYRPSPRETSLRIRCNPGVLVVSNTLMSRILKTTTATLVCFVRSCCRLTIQTRYLSGTRVPCLFSSCKIKCLNYIVSPFLVVYQMSFKPHKGVYMNPLVAMADLD